MARKERIVADPVEVAIAGRKEVDLHKGAIQVAPDGIDWGDYEINAFMAKQAMGEIPVDEEIPNRVIVIPLILGAEGDFDAARIAVQAWAAKVNHQGGGHLKREIIGGSYGEAGKKLYCDAVKATLKLSGDSEAASDGIDANAVLSVEALPDFYGDKIEEAAFEGNGEAAKTFQIKGNLPGRAEILVEEKSGRSQLALPWHFRCQDYDVAAPWAANVSSFERFGVAAEVTIAGSIATKVVQHSNLSTQWTPIAAKTYPHKGLYEVLVRAYTTSPTPPEVRLVYDVGDLLNPSETSAMQIPGTSGWYLISLGVVNLEQLPIGTHRWRPLLQARGAQGGENIAFDKIWFRNATECGGVPTAPRRITEGLAAPVLYDAFNQSAGNATGKSPNIGSAYTVCTNSDTDDFQIDAATHSLVRSTIEDSGTIAAFLRGRGIGSGTAKLTNHKIVNDLTLPGDKESSFAGGHIVRWVDTKNFVACYLEERLGADWQLVVVKVTAGVSRATTVLLGAGYKKGLALTGRLETIVFEGLLIVSLDDREIYRSDDSAMAPGQALGEGRAFIYDHNVGAEAKTRRYDNLEIAPVTFEAVNFANQKAWLSHRGLYRMGPTGEGYGPIARPNSDLPRIPVSGPEERPVELAVKTSRGDLEAVQDAGTTDALAVRLSYRPCWSSVPGL